MMIPGKTLVIGLGNPILGDDSVGWRIAEGVRAALEEAAQASPASIPGPVEVDCLSVGGLSLMERLVDSDRAILIDAIQTGYAAPGQVFCLPVESLPHQAVGHINSAHDTTLQAALQVGHSMGARLPDRIEIVAVEAQCLYEFSEELTPPVAAAVPAAIQVVLDLLSNRQVDPPGG